MEDSSHGAGNDRGVQTTPSIRSAEDTVNLLVRLNAGAKKIFACFDRVGRQGVTTAEPMASIGSRGLVQPSVLCAAWDQSV